MVASKYQIHNDERLRVIDRLCGHVARVWRDALFGNKTFLLHAKPEIYDHARGHILLGAGFAISSIQHEATIYGWISTHPPIYICDERL